MTLLTVEQSTQFKFHCDKKPIYYYLHSWTTITLNLGMVSAFWLHLFCNLCSFLENLPPSCEDIVGSAFEAPRVEEVARDEPEMVFLNANRPMTIQKKTDGVLFSVSFKFYSSLAEDIRLGTGKVPLRECVPPWYRPMLGSVHTLFPLQLNGKMKMFHSARKRKSQNMIQQMKTAVQ